MEYPFFDTVVKRQNLPSTMSLAKRMIANSQMVGNGLIIAKRQTAAVGRSGKSWVSDFGGIYFTMALYKLQVEPTITLFCGVVLHRTLKKLFPQIEFQIKWPNDLMLHSKKVAGILTKFYHRYEYHTIGIGINTNNKPDEKISQIATCLSDFVEVDNSQLLEEFFAMFALLLPSFIANGLDVEYLKKYAFLTGKNVLLKTEFADFRGRVVSHTADGGLVLQLAQGLKQTFYVGSVVEVEQ